MAVGDTSFRYSPRTICPYPPVFRRGWTVKRYGISATRPAPPEEVMVAADSRIEASLPDAYPDAPSYAVLMAHEDDDGCYVVVAWWSPNGYIASTRTWLSTWDDVAAFVPAPPGVTACVWELLTLARERDAWVDHVLKSPTPDLAGYLAATVAGSF